MRLERSIFVCKRDHGRRRLGQAFGTAMLSEETLELLADVEEKLLA